MHRFLSIVWWLSVCSVCSVGTLRSQPANVQADPTTGVLFRPSAATFISGNNLATAAGGIVLGANGGTGVANTGKTITLGGNVTTSGAFGLTLTLSGTTNVTLPTSGQLATLSGGEILTNKILTSPTLTTPILGAATATSLTLSGNISSAAWTTSGARLKGVAATLTDTTSTGTVAAAYTDVLGGNTIAASNATTFTDYITAYFREPTAGSLVTMTNKWALGSESLRVGTSTPMTVSTAGAITANSLTGPATTNLTLAGGSTGASLVLGQGATAGNATITPTGTGVVAIAGTGSKLTIAGTTAATNTTSGAVQIGANIGLSGNSGGPSYFGGPVSFSGNTPSPTADGQGFAGTTASQGFIFQGRGSTNDFNFYNKSGSSVLSVATGTQNINLPGTTSASSSTAGALTIGNGTAATNVAIGGGNVNAGGTLTVSGNTVLSGSTGHTGKIGVQAAASTNNSGIITIGGSAGAVAGYGAGGISDSSTFTAVANADDFSSWGLYPTLAKGAFTGITYRGIDMQSPSVSGAGTIATHIGINVRDVNRGTANFAIKTGSGVVSVGDTTASTGVGTGALQVAGGIYAGAASVFGGNITTGGALASFGSGTAGVEIRASGDSTSTPYGYWWRSGSTYEASMQQVATTGVLTLDVGRNSSWGGKFDITVDTTRSVRFAKNLTTFDQPATFAGAVTTSSTTLSGAGAIPITTSLVKFTSTGAANALTLANGSDGQRLTIVHDVKGTLGTGVLTPTTKTGFSTVTFNNAGDTVSLVYVTTRGWMVTGSYLATIAP